MKNATLLLIYFWFFFLQTANAQTNGGQVSGVIYDGQNQPLFDVNIRLILLKDSSVIKIIATDEKGRFRFKQIPNNSYLLVCTHIGYNKFKTTPFAIDNSNPVINLPIISMVSTDNSNLKVVVVTAKKPLIQHKIDRTIVNVETMSTAAGSNILEVMSKSPGVMVDINGDIALDGKAGVLVLVDDKPTYLSTQDLAAYLKSLPAGIVDRLELITNPPAKYEASNGAIINIVLKKNKLVGFNGNFNVGYTQGKYARSNNALNLNYRQQKLNIFSNLSYGRDQNFRNENSQRYFYSPDGSPTSTILMDNHYTYLSNGYNLRMGMDYTASLKTILGIVVSGNIRPKSDQLSYSSQQFDNNLNQENATMGVSTGNYLWKNGGVNFNVQHKFDSTGTTFSADIDLITYQSDGTQLLTNQNSFLDSSQNNAYTIRYDLPGQIHIYSVKADYSHPFNTDARFDAGFKSSLVNNDNSSQWFDFSGTDFQPNYQNSNHFVYQENINAIYANVSKEWNRWGLQSGLRIENTNAKGHLLGNIAIGDSTFSKTYLHIFPSVSVSYKMDAKGDNNLVLNYNTRIRRPNYQQLNPFILMRDKYNYSAGNPNLIPTFSQNIGLKYTYKNIFGLTLAYLYGHQTSNLTQQSGDILISKPENFGINYSWNLIPYLSLNPAKNWNLQVSGIVFYLTNRGNAFGQLVDNKVLAGELELNNQFNFGKGWNAELNGFYASKQIGGQSIMAPIEKVEASLQKNVFGNKGTIRLKIDDLFYSITRHETIVGLANQSAFRTSKSDTRAIGFSLNYRFGNQGNTKKRNHTNGGAEDEKGRTN